jgi:hypothetical protein
MIGEVEEAVHALRYTQDCCVKQAQRRARQQGVSRMRALEKAGRDGSAPLCLSFRRIAAQAAGVRSVTGESAHGDFALAAFQIREADRLVQISEFKVFAAFATREEGEKKAHGVTPVFPPCR